MARKTKTEPMTVERIEAEIQQMDPACAGKTLRAATVLMAALHVGTGTDALVKFTAYPKREVQAYVRSAFANRIFVENDLVAGKDWFKKDGAMSFWLDVNCALGLMQRSAA